MYNDSIDDITCIIIEIANEWELYKFIIGLDFFILIKIYKNGRLNGTE